MNRKDTAGAHRYEHYLWLIIFNISVIGFALTSHREAWWLWRWGCLTLCGVSLCGSWSAIDHPFQTIIGKPRLSHPLIRVLIVAFLGLPAALGYRQLLEISAFPSTLCWFVLIAMGVGAVEELLWRGWMQGTLSCFLGKTSAVILAAVSHAAYKTALFYFPPEKSSPHGFEGLILIAGLTFIFGVLLGYFRARQGTIAGPVAFHMIFDLIVYGQYETAPWWVF